MGCQYVLLPSVAAATAAAVETEGEPKSGDRRRKREEAAHDSSDILIETASAIVHAHPPLGRVLVATLDSRCFAEQVLCGKSGMAKGKW